MKKLLATALTAITILSANTTVFATEIEPVNTERITVKVGYLDDYGIITTPIVQGSEGYGYEYLEKLEAYTNYNFEYVDVSWAEGLEKLKDGKIDLLAPANMSDERKETYDFVETVFSSEETNIYALADSDYYFDEPNQLNGKTFGTMEGGIYEERFKAYAKEHDLDYTLKYTSHDTVVDDIGSGEIDFYIDGSLYVRDDVYSVGKIYTEELYLMTQKGNDSLTNTLNSAMLALESDEPFYNETLWFKYYGTSHKATQKLTVDEVTALQAKDVYTVGYHTDLHPISYTWNGQPKGYSIDVMNILADKLGIEVRYVPLQDSSENSTEDVDFDLNMIDYARSNYGTMSVPYDNVKLLIVKNKGLENSDVKNILVPDYSSVEIEDFLDLYPSATIHKAYSTSDCNNINSLVDIDCLVISESSEMFIEDKANKSISVLDVSVPIGITVSNELPTEVRTALNKAILSLKEGTVDELVKEHVNALQKSAAFINFLKQYKEPILAVLLFLVIIFAILWKSHKNAKHLLEVDTLTGAMTKYKFIQETQQILATAKPNEYMLILLDVDKFKTINKIYGTQTGDKLLCVLADSLKKQINKDTIVGRIQNDAFAILKKSKSIARVPLDEMFLEELKLAGIDISVYFSVGVYIIENTTDDIAYIFDNARTAKGYGKKTFGNTINYFTKELQAKHEKESAILSSIETALNNKEFFIVIQPKVELLTERLVGGEVLVRWKKKDGTFVYPDEFIPLFEENKFIIQLDGYVLEKTCEYIRDSKLTLPVLSVNISAITMMEPGFVQNGLDILERYGVIPQQIEVELTENVLDYDYKRISKALVELKKAGFSIAVDDFGKGASSLARIKEIEMDVLKLDKNFIEDNAENEKGKLVLNNIISMASDLNINSLAEGIETKEQKDLLIQLGCEYGQGYLFDHPLSTLDFTQRVEANSKVAFEPVLRYQKDSRFWAESKDLTYGVAVAKNDHYFTVIQANDAFYDIIGYDKDNFRMKHNNRLVSILVDNLYNLAQKYLRDKQYAFSFDLRILASDGEIIWAHCTVKYDPADDLFFLTMVKIDNQNYLQDSVVAHVDFSQPSNQTSDGGEQQNSIQEERSKSAIVNLCINMLRTNITTTTATATTTTTILELLREHYGAKSCAIVHFSPEEHKYEVRYLNTDLNAYPNLAALQNFDYNTIEKIVTAFEKNKYALLECKMKDLIGTETEREKWEMIAIDNAYLATMFDVDNKCNGILMVTNPSLTTRSTMLIQVVSKFLSDYQIKHDIYMEEKVKNDLEPMTGLLNKVATKEKIEKLLKNGNNGTLYMIDVDNFKQINDKLGHAMGDKVIVDNAKLLQGIFRKEDLIGRVGGDEFMVYAPNLITEQAVCKKAEQIVKAFAKTYEKNGIKVQISASVGVCVSLKNSETFQHLYQEADKEIYRAKAQGKNQFCIAKIEEN